MKPMGQIDGTDFATDAELDASLARGVGPRTEAGKALIEWAENAYPAQDQVRIWREHAVAIEAEASGEARPTPVEPEARPDPDWEAIDAELAEHEGDFDSEPFSRRLAVEPDGLPLDPFELVLLEAAHYDVFQGKVAHENLRMVVAAARESAARLASTPSEAKP